jgi:hypothetical protein
MASITSSLITTVVAEAVVAVVCVSEMKGMRRFIGHKIPTM